MAGTAISGGPSSYVYTRRVARVHKYHWPAVQLNVWMLVMVVASCVVVGVFASFLDVQATLGLAAPWYFGYFITVGALTVAFVGLLLWLISRRRLLPAIVILGAFLFFVLWMVGLVVVSIELWGPRGSVSANCRNLVFDRPPTPANSVANLAWLQQKGICQSWHAVFAFALIGAIFLLWIIVIAIQVFYDDA